jgi:hypothetical protein
MVLEKVLRENHTEDKIERTRRRRVWGDVFNNFLKGMSLVSFHETSTFNT